MSQAVAGNHKDTLGGVGAEAVYEIAPQALAGGERGEFAAGIARQTVRRGNPKVASLIFVHFSDRIVRQTLGRRVRGKFPGPIPDQSAAVSADPQRPLIVLHQAADLIVAEFVDLAAKGLEVDAVKANQTTGRGHPDKTIARFGDRPDANRSSTIGAAGHGIHPILQQWQWLLRVGQGYGRQPKPQQHNRRNLSHRERRFFYHGFDNFSAQSTGHAAITIPLSDVITIFSGDIFSARGCFDAIFAANALYLPTVNITTRASIPNCLSSNGLRTRASATDTKTDT